MKKRWLKRILALGLTALMGMSSLTAFANQTDPTPVESDGSHEGWVADDETKKVKIWEADEDFYEALLESTATEAEKDKGLPTTATINITKKVTDDVEFDTGFTQDAKPVRNVRFSIKKVGVVSQVQQDTNITMVYGIDRALVDDTFKADYIDDIYSYVKDYKKINDFLKGKNASDIIVNDKDMGWSSATTNDNGEISFENKKFGLYLVIESDVSKAETKTKMNEETGAFEWEPMTITEKQYPYVVSAPIYTPKTDANPNGKWDADVNARAKNSTGTTESEKKIVKDADGLEDVSNNSKLVDNDNTHIGDTVVFKLTNGVVEIKEGDINSYIIQDSLSKGFTFTDENGEVISGNIEIKDSNNPVVTYEYGRDYTVTIVNESDIEENKDPDGLSWDGRYPDGTNIKIEFTENGLGKLTELSKNKDISKKELYVYYTAVVDKDAIVVSEADIEGKSGNPNQSRLIFRANNSNTITTGWDEVREYIFTMDGHKTFDGVSSTVNAQFVTFELFTKENNDFVPANVTEETVEGTTESIPGTYVYGGTSNTVKLDTENGKFSIKGVPTGVTLYLKETETADGFNLLKEPIEIELTAVDNTTGESDGKTEWGTLTAGTVNGKDALNSTTDATGVIFTIDNTSGFQLPSTGGMGSTIFAIVGMLIIAVGGVFFLATSKRKR